jgi:hypothetical protein
MIIREVGLEALIGKKIGDIITDETKILTKFMDDYEIRDQILKEHNLSKESYEDFDVLTDFGNDIVICFKNNQAVCLFNVYDIEDVSLNGKRGVVTAIGHETAHEYWFDDGEYNERHTR